MQAIVFDEAIFLITQKVASVSIQSALAIWAGHEPTDGPEIFNYIPAENVVYYSQPKIAFVRDPWSRLLSCYRQKIEGKKYSTFGQWDMYGNMPFPDFVGCVQKHWSNPNIHWAPCYLWARYATTIVRFENLETEWNNLPLDLPSLPHYLNTGSSGLVDEYYDGELIKKVRDMYVEDVENWYGD